MRILIRVSLLALLVTPCAMAQNTGRSQGLDTHVDNAELREISSGAQWKVYEQVDVSGTAADRNTFAVFPALVVDELEAEGVLPAFEAQEIRDDLAAEGLDYREVADIFIVHLEAVKEAAEKSANLSPGDLEMAEKDCFGWSGEKTKSASWDWSHPGGVAPINIEEDEFDGTVGATLPLTAEINGSVTYRIKEVFCAPTKLRLIEAVVDGEVAIRNGGIDISGEFEKTFNWNWDRNLYTKGLGHITFAGPFRVNFKLRLDVGVETDVKVAGSAEISSDVEVVARFNLTCLASDCDGTSSFDDNFDVADAEYEFTLDANARLWARITVSAEVIDDKILEAKVGATGFVQAHLFGYLGNQCGDLDGDGAGDTIEDLLFDLDAGYSVDAELDGFFVSDKEWNLLSGSRHLFFRDLWEDSEGWNVLDPLVTGPDHAEAGGVLTYTLATRPCYPFSDDLNMQWTGPVTGTGSLTPRTGSFVASYVPTAGVHTLEVTMVDDTHGRGLDVSTSKPVTVTYPDFYLPDADDRFGYALAGGDFDCDGHEDLAVGVPWKDFGNTPDTGLVTVLLASPGGSGLPSMGDGRVLHLFNRPVAANATTGARFGYELAAGDFNGDGCADLAVGAPWDRESEGTAQVLYGSADPAVLLVERDDIFLDSASFPGDGAQGDRLGQRMAAGDLDGDSYDDLAITSPGRNNIGAVLVVHGSSAGTGKVTLIDQDTPGVPGVAQKGSGSDMDVAIGDFDGDGRGDLAIGFPRAGDQARDDGFVAVLYSTDNGLALFDNDGFGQGDLANGGKSENGDLFGWALAAGDFDGDGYDDLAVGSPRETWGRTAHTGIAHVVKGSVNGLRWPSGVELLHQSKLGLAMASPSYFGSALEAADFNGDGYDDLAIGAHAKSQLFDVPGPGLVISAGETYVAYGQGDGTFDIPGRNGSTDGHVFSRVTPGFEGSRNPGMQTGFSLGAGDFDGDGMADLVVGSIGSEIDGQTEAGSCNVLYGHPAQLSTLGSLHLEQNRNPVGVPGEDEEGTCGISDSVTDLSGGKEAKLLFTQDVDACASTLTVTLSGGTGDPDLYVRFDSRPTTETFDCRSWNSDTNESCTFTPAQAGTYYILVHGYSAFAGVTLSASYE